MQCKHLILVICYLCKYLSTFVVNFQPLSKRIVLQQNKYVVIVFAVVTNTDKRYVSSRRFQLDFKFTGLFFC